MAELPSCLPTGLTEITSDLPMGVLHLSARAGALERAGFRSIRDLEGVPTARLLRIPAVGRSTVDQLVQRADALLRSVMDSADVDWERYCSLAGIPLLPTTIRPSTGNEFLTTLPQVLQELADRIRDKTTARILRDRICRPPSEQQTLEELALVTTPRLTRERIRQKEKKLLGQLTGGLLNDDYDQLGIHFHPSFSQWWRLAADRLAKEEELDFRDFVEALASVWDVEISAVVEHLPTILAIVTGDPQMPAGFRSAMHIEACWYGADLTSLRELNVHRVRFDKDAVTLVGHGLHTVADVGNSIRSGSFRSLPPATQKRVASHLNMLAPHFAPERGVLWDAYRQSLGLRPIPAQPPATVREFVSSLSATLTELISACQPTLRAVQIYSLRTSRPPDRRMTLHAVADELGTHQPTVKREETLFLEYLHDVLVERKFSSLPVWLDESWLGYWREAERVFQGTDQDYATFSENLAWRWRLTETELSSAMPSIWAVLTGYPSGRPGRGSYSDLSADAGMPLGTIRLRGFRRLH